jgi:hypothetical protein
VATPKSQVEVEVEEKDEVTRPSDLGFPSAQQPQPQYREIEVEPVTPRPVQEDNEGMVEIRMAQTIEEFTYGNPHFSYRLEEGKRYRVPRYVAAYLWDLGYVYQR